MDEKNKFSRLLDHLMSTVGLKNAALAQALQYDVSYISKWISGRVLPTEKSADKIMREISRCIVRSLNADTRQTLYIAYNVDTDENLEAALTNDLQLAYAQSRVTPHNTVSNNAPVEHYPEMSFLQFVSIINEPAANESTEMDIAMLFDVLSMNHEYRMGIAEIDAGQKADSMRDYPNIHFSVLINLGLGQRNFIYDTVFLINMLYSLSQVNLKVYEDDRAYGKYIFAVKNRSMLSGMSLDSRTCLSVTRSGNPDHATRMYHQIRSLCTRERLLFRKASMSELLNSHRYIQFLLGGNLRWLMGHMTEYFLPDDLFSRLLDRSYEQDSWNTEKETVQQMHDLTRRVLEETPLRFLVYASALQAFAVTGELDFFDHKLTLTPEERLEYLQELSRLLKDHHLIKIKIISDELVPDYKYPLTSCLLMSDDMQWLRLGRHNYHNNIVLLNNSAVREMFFRFFEAVWSESPDVVQEDPTSIADTLRRTTQMVQLLVADTNQ